MSSGPLLGRIGLLRFDEFLSHGRSIGGPGGERPRALHTTHTTTQGRRGGGGAASEASAEISSPPRRKKKASVVAAAAGESHEHGTMACYRALALHHLPASAPSLHAPCARIGAHRPRPSLVWCCAVAGDQAEQPQDAVLKAISREESSLLLFFSFSQTVDRLSVVIPTDASSFNGLSTSAPLVYLVSDCYLMAWHLLHLAN